MSESKPPSKKSSSSTTEEANRPYPESDDQINAYANEIIEAHENGPRLVYIADFGYVQFAGAKEYDNDWAHDCEVYNGDVKDERYYRNKVVAKAVKRKMAVKHSLQSSKKQSLGNMMMKKK